MNERAAQSRVVVIPTFNTGPTVYETVRSAAREWPRVWVVVDGSDDGTGEELENLARELVGVRVFHLSRNSGKGAAVLHAARQAEREGVTHILCMDADGQHPADQIPEFMKESTAHPDAMVLGVPQFDESAPSVRVRGRRISNWWANLETGPVQIGDSLFGFRVYPVGPLCDVMTGTRWMRRFDFDPEAAVRLAWRGVPAINIPARVRYLRPEEGGISHFHYLRDNVLLTWMHARLVCGFLLRLPKALMAGAKSRPAPASES